MQRHITFTAMGAACALLLAACGGSGDDRSAPPPPAAVTPPVATKLEPLSSTTRVMDSVVFNDGSAYLSLANSATEGSAVLTARLPLSASSTWSPVGLGACAMGPIGDFIQRSPKLKMVGGDMWLMQPWADTPEASNGHSTCTLVANTASFIPRDQDLKTCNPYFCETLSMQDLKQAGNRLYSNAGAGNNLLTSNDKGNTWQVIRGSKDSQMCYPTKFHVIGDRVLVGGECPLDFAFVEAYRLTKDGGALASEDKLPIALPEMENRNVQFIESVPGTEMVFVGVEGGLLRSTDNGNSFKFVIHEPLSGGKGYPYIGAFLPLKGKPGSVVVGGFDKMHGRPYLAWTRDGGSSWTDISKLVPGYDSKQEDEYSTPSVSALSQDPDGRIIVVTNERADSQGRLMQLTLGTN
ncbi:hypothetical protein [Massilia sp. HP4]|uniref:hypothetical protein n=1 Tax=Massilia sp. HP4 TaxID=2562316 RepID=UPI001E2AEAD7|nr:hypothetical protein [Massilia sp. HP4]